MKKLRYQIGDSDPPLGTPCRAAQVRPRAQDPELLPGICDPYLRHLTLIQTSLNVQFGSIDCIKSVQISSFFWSIFSCICTEYGDLRSKYPNFENFHAVILQLFQTVSHTNLYNMTQQQISQLKTLNCLKTSIYFFAFLFTYSKIIKWHRSG